MSLDDNIKHPFKTPDGYFDDLEDRILSQVKIQNIKHPFKVEEGYFDDLEERILSQTTKKGKVLRINYNTIYRIAAGVLIFFSLGYFGYKNYVQQPNYDMSDLQTEEIVAFLESDPVAYKFANENLEELVPMADIKNVDAINMNNISEEDIEDFLPPNSLDQ